MDDQTEKDSPKIGVARRILADLLPILGGRVPLSEAQALGVPQGVGMTREDLRLLLQRPEREAEVEEKKARAEFFKRSLGRGVPQTLNEKNQRLKQLENLVLGRQGIVIKTTSPDAFNVLDSEYQNLRNELGKPTTAALTTSQFTAPEQVRDAFREGRITREQARKEIQTLGIKR